MNGPLNKVNLSICVEHNWTTASLVFSLICIDVLLIFWVQVNGQITLSVNLQLISNFHFHFSVYNWDGMLPNYQLTTYTSFKMTSSTILLFTLMISASLMMAQAASVQGDLTDQPNMRFLIQRIQDKFLSNDSLKGLILSLLEWISSVLVEVLLRWTGFTPGLRSYRTIGVIPTNKKLNIIKFCC